MADRESPQDAARRLFSAQIRDGFTPTGLYLYENEKGPVFYRARLDRDGDKYIRPFHFDGTAFVIGEPQLDASPLYNLPAILARPQERVYVVEGEKCADALAGLGLLATTSGGSSSAGKADWTPLSIRDLVVWPDDDEAGAKYAVDVLRAVPHSQIVDVDALGLPVKGDCVDWMEANPNADVADIEALPWVNPEDTGIDTSESSDTHGHRRISTSSRLVALALQSDIDLWHDTDGKAYASIEIADHQEHWPIRCRMFRSWLARELWSAENRAASSQALQDTLSVLEGYAVHDGSQHEVHVRMAEHDGRIYLDVCDEEWRVVEVTPNGWKVVSDPPVRFRRRKGMQALSLPVEGGNLDELREFINVRDKDWPLEKGWLVGCFNVKGPHAGKAYSGEQGSGKTTSAKVSKRLIDPNEADLRSAPRNAYDLMIAATNSWIVGFDNLSTLRPSLSDDLARLATGAGFSTRKLYENDEETLFSACRPVLLNAIEDVVTRPDLLDRFIVIRAPRLPDFKRQDERTFWSKFEFARPRILGALLNAVSRALRNLPDTVLDQQPRMLDFARFAVAAESVEEKGKFLAAYMENRRDTQEMAMDADLVAQAIHGYIEQQSEWIGTAQELADLLVPEKPAKDWPVTGQQMAGALKRAAPVLRAKGLDIEYDDKSRPRKWLLRTTAKLGGATDISDATRMNAGDAARHLSVTSRQSSSTSDGTTDGLKPAPAVDSVTSVTSVTLKQDLSDGVSAEVEIDI